MAFIGILTIHAVPQKGAEPGQSGRERHCPPLSTIAPDYRGALPLLYIERYTRDRFRMLYLSPNCSSSVTTRLAGSTVRYIVEFKIYDIA